MGVSDESIHEESDNGGSEVDNEDAGDVIANDGDIEAGHHIEDGISIEVNNEDNCGVVEAMLNGEDVVSDDDQAMQMDDVEPGEFCML